MRVQKSRRYISISVIVPSTHSVAPLLHNMRNAFWVFWGKCVEYHTKYMVRTTHRTDAAATQLDSEHNYCYFDSDHVNWMLKYPSLSGPYQMIVVCS